MLCPLLTSYVNREGGVITKDNDLDLDAYIGNPHLILLLNVRAARGFVRRVVVPVR